MNDIDAREMLIREYDALKRILDAGSMEAMTKEAERQMKTIKMRMQAMSIPTEDLDE